MNIQQWLNKSTKPTTKENEYKPKMGVSDEHRKEFFTNVNVGLLNEIRRVKLNQINKV